MLLWMSSGFSEVGLDSPVPGTGDLGWSDQHLIDLSGHVAFQAAHDVLLREPLAGAALDVGARALVMAHKTQDDGVQRVVGSPVARALGTIGPKKRILTHE